MKDLIDAIVAILEAGITASRISATKVQKALTEEPWQMADSEYPYIMVDDGGERTEETESTEAQNRFYSVIIDMGTYSLKDIGTAMDAVLDLTNEVKDELSLEANRLKDGFLWGVTVVPYSWDSEGSFFRGRTVVVDWIELEDRIFRY